MHFINEDTFQNLFTFAPMFSLLILDSNRKIDWISTRISSEKINHLILTYNDYKPKQLHKMLLKTSVYVKRYDGQTKWMCFD